jgi:ERCC4-type nuclease
MKNKDITIIQDTREQKPWVFDIEDKARPDGMRIIGTEVKKIEAGDYTILGLEDKICIEKKSGITELFNNMIPSANQERFCREMEKLREIKHKYLIIESNLDNDMLKMSIQQFKYPVPASRVVKWIYELQAEYDIVPIFAGNTGKKVCRYLFDMIGKKYL